MWSVSSLLFYVSIDIVLATVDYLQHPVKSCHIGDTVENECNKCLCTSKGVFECTPLDCDKNKHHEEVTSTQLCYPHQLYVENLITCICTKDGRWPHKSCHDTFQSLPPSKVIKHSCSPDTYAFIDCNVCRCGPDGEINSDHCTRNLCEEETKRRASNIGPSSVYSNCEVKNWYSLAPCQFCFCVNTNKLVCNTGNYYSKKLELGSYNLRVCGKDLISEAIELIPDNQKMLRYGFNVSNTSTTTLPTAQTKSSPPIVQSVNTRDDQNIDFYVNRERNKNKTSFGKQVEISSSQEYYTDSEEDSALPVAQKLRNVPQTATVVTIMPTLPTEPPKSKGPSTNFPFEESDEMLNESGVKTDEDNEDDSSKMLVEVDSAITATPKTKGVIIQKSPSKVHTLKMAESSESYQYVGNTLKINLPNVLNKVFAMALRKSMVSLSNQTKCTPGATTVNDCNMCFCLKNSKLLCTKKNCSESKTSSINN